MRTRIVTYLLLLFGISTVSHAEWGLQVESGAVFSGYNNVEIPRDIGTRFSLTNDLKTDSKLFYRVRLFYNLDSSNHFSILAAPLSLNAEGFAPRDIVFEGTTFLEGSRLKAKYRFDSYRLTYRRRIINNGWLTGGLGLTAKIRDAAVTVEDDAVKAEKTNTGLVPLINFQFRMRLNSHTYALLEGDALAAPQGRAEDVLVALGYSLSDYFGVYAGYRILEGGADVEEVYNFALLHYITMGVSLKFQ